LYLESSTISIKSFSKRPGVICFDILPRKGDGERKGGRKGGGGGGVDVSTGGWGEGGSCRIGDAEANRQASA
jgi:hypothetical protein